MAADELVAVDKLVGKRFFEAMPAYGLLPAGVEIADAQFAKNVLFQIGLHYARDYVARVGWQGIAWPYLSHYKQRITFELRIRSSRVTSDSP